MTASKHLTNDRKARTDFIKNTVGIGHIIKERIVEKYGRLQRSCVTDTGVMVIKSYDEEKVITMWIATLGQIAQVYVDEVIPDELKMKARDNSIYQHAQRMLTYQ